MSKIGSWIRCMVLVMLCVALIPFMSYPVLADEAEDTVLPAFPGAEGFGYATTGGRGGEVYHVTSYELTGPGTLHDALTTVGDEPRTIVFEISGEITIPQIIVRNKSNITIAGQTAPGEGVVIRGNNIRFIHCDNIIIRYLSFRMGKQDAQDDTMYFEDCQNVIIDHSSFSWGTDEVLSILSKDYNNPQSKNITVQWSVISEGLLTHSMGGLIEMNTISMHHNLYAHNNDRNPKTKGQIDFVNNVVYNWGEFPYVAGGESGTKGYGNVVGNYFVAGLNSADPHYAVVRGNENYSLYLHDNRIDSNKNGILDGTDTGTDMMEAARPSVIVPERFNYPPVHTQDPETAYEYVLDYAGSSLHRDAVDERIIDSVRSQTGVIIWHEDDMGGFPVLSRETGPLDTDRDGMPDEWEIANGLDPNDPSDRNGDMTGDGYTNLEKYLNELAAPGFPDGYPMEPLEWTGVPFAPPEPEPEPQPEPELLPRIDGQIIRNMVVNDNSGNGAANAANWSVQRNLQAGDIVAGDRMTGSNVYRFVSIPEQLQGEEWIRSAVGSRSSTGEDLVSFYLTVDADVYVAHDARISPKPAWLTEFEHTGDKITDDQPVDYELYKKRYEAGSHVILGPNGNSSRMNYFVVVQPVVPPSEPQAEAPQDLYGRLEGDVVTLGWTPVSGAEAYLIYRASSQDPFYRVIGSADTAEYADHDVELGVTYEYQVSALAGGETPLSDPLEVLTFDSSYPSPAAPTDLEASVVRSMSVELEWTPVEDAVSYAIYRAEEPGGTYERIGYASSSRYVDKTASPDTTYSYQVTATGIGGESARSAPVTATTEPPVALPSIPNGLTAKEVSVSSFEISWHAVEGAEEYIVYRQAEGESGYALLDRTASTSYVDKSVSTANAGYSYKVSAVNEMGESAPSEELTIKLPLPEAPSDLIVGWVGESFVGLIWTAGRGGSEVNVYREADGIVEYVGYAKVNTFYDRTAEPGVQYTYYIKARNAAGESEASNAVTVKPGYPTVLRNYADQYERTGHLSGPIVSRLQNTLRQAEHHADRGNLTQAVRFMERYAEQLEQDHPSSEISALAKRTLLQYANLYLEKLNHL